MLACARKLQITCLCAFCFLPFIVCTAIAQPFDHEDSIELDTTFDQPLTSSPSGFTTIIRPKKASTEHKTLTEILSGSPGVQTKELGGPGQHSTVTIRGSSAEQVAVFVDGIKVNTASGGGIDFSTIPIDSIDRIEILRGGGTTRFGSDAIGGVINIITKRPKKGREIELNGTYGSFTTIKSNESLSENKESYGMVLSHTHAQSRGNYTFKSAPTNLAGVTLGGGLEFTRLHNGYISEDVLTKFNVLPMQNLNIRFSNDFYFSKRDISGIEEETTQFYPANLLEAEETMFRNMTAVVMELNNLFDKHLSLETGVTNNFNKDNFKDPSPAIGTAIDRDTVDDSVGTYLLARPSFKNNIFTHLMSLRYDYRYDYFRDSSDIANTPLTGKKTRSSHGLFFEDEIGFASNRISLIPAARFENTSNFPDDISLKLGVAVTPIKLITLKGNIETSFRYPNFSELYFPDHGYIRGNPDLAKEEAVNYDAGLVFQHDIARLEVSYFKNDIKNQILWVPISATTIQPINTYDATAYGIETSASLTPLKFLSLDANYTWLVARFKSNNLQLPGRPHHKINARYDLRHNFSKKIGGNIFSEVQYVSALPINTQNTVFIAGRTAFDVGASARFSPRPPMGGSYTLTFTAKDITNVQIYDARGFPLPRRSFFITLGVKWS